MFAQSTSVVARVFDMDSGPDSPTKQFRKLEGERFMELNSVLEQYKRCLTDREQYVAMESAKYLRASKPVEQYLFVTKDNEDSPYRHSAMIEFKVMAKRGDAMRTQTERIRKYRNGLDQFESVVESLRSGDKYKEVANKINKRQ